MKKLKDITGNQTRDLPACSIVALQTKLPHAPMCVCVCVCVCVCIAYIYIYIYMCVCVCVCVCALQARWLWVQVPMRSLNS
jgi:hypothetical protein